MNDLSRFDDYEPAPPLEVPLWNGYYTLYCPDGSRHFFRVHTRTHGHDLDRRVLSVLIGPENTNDYEPCGWVTPSGIEFFRKVLVKTREHGQILQLMAQGCEADGYELAVDKKCLFCNRILSTPSAVQRGIGDTCFKRYGGYPR